MTSIIEEGTYTISLPHGESCITETGEGQDLNILPPGELGEHAHKITVTYDQDQGAYSLQFADSKNYLTWVHELRMNTRLVAGDKVRYFQIEQHENEQDKYTLGAAEAKEYHVAMAMEKIYPPMVAMSPLPGKQAWVIQKI